MMMMMMMMMVVVVVAVIMMMMMTRRITVKGIRIRIRDVIVNLMIMTLIKKKNKLD